MEKYCELDFETLGIEIKILCLEKRNLARPHSLFKNSSLMKPDAIFYENPILQE